MDPDELSEERDQQAFVEVLLQRDALEGAASGIAKKFVADGSRALSEKQLWVLHAHVLEAHKVKSCDHCAGTIPWSEQLDALDNGGLCGVCQRRWDRVMSEK